MRAWSVLLAGLAIWAAHFFLLYAIASVFPGRSLATGLVLIATVPAIAANLAVLRRLHAASTDSSDIEGWVARVAGLAAAFSLLAVLWQALPAVFV